MGKIYQGKQKYPVDEIIVHCSATSPDWMEDYSVTDKRDEIDRWHKARGWWGFGYHFLIDRDGSLAEGRSIKDIGAHVKGRNRGTVGVCLVGGRGASSDDFFRDHFTFKQDVILRGLIGFYAAYGEIHTVSGHNDYAPKACPGFGVDDWLENGVGGWG